MFRNLKNEKCSQNGSLWDEGCVQNGSKMRFSKSDLRLFQMPKLVFFSPFGAQFSPVYPLAATCLHQVVPFTCISEPYYGAT